MGEGSIHLTLFIRVTAQGRPAGWRCEGGLSAEGPTLMEQIWRSCYLSTHFSPWGCSVVGGMGRGTAGRAAYVTSVVSNSHRPHGLQPTHGSSVHGIFQARVLEWGATTFFLLTPRRIQTQKSDGARTWKKSNGFSQFKAGGPQGSRAAWIGNVPLTPVTRVRSVKP